MVFLFYTRLYNKRNDEPGIDNTIKQLLRRTLVRCIFMQQQKPSPKKKLNEP